MQNSWKLLFVLALFGAVHLHAQGGGGQQILPTTVDPTGLACTAQAMRLLTPGGTIFTCSSGVFAAVAGSGGNIAHTTNVLKGDNTGNAISAGFAGTSAGVVGLFTGCSGVLYLGADGACHTNGGGSVAHAIGVTFVNGGAALSGTSVSCEPILFTGTITDVYTTADISGSATVGIKTIASGSYTGVAGYSGYTSIVASAPPSLSSATYYHDATLTGWTTSLTKGQMLCVQESSPSTVTNLQVVLVYSGAN